MPILPAIAEQKPLAAPPPKAMPKPQKRTFSPGVHEATPEEAAAAARRSAGASLLPVMPLDRQPQEPPRRAGEARKFHDIERPGGGHHSALGLRSASHRRQPASQGGHQPATGGAQPATGKAAGWLSYPGEETVQAEFTDKGQFYWEAISEMREEPSLVSPCVLLRFGSRL